jgi:hypothetical protein
MPPLPDPALNAVLKEWNPKEYDPPNTDVQEWTHTIESLCETYRIPDDQRPQCAVNFVKAELRNELEKVLEDARAKFGPVHWAQFKIFMKALDRKWGLEIIESLITEILQKISGRDGMVGASYSLIDLRLLAVQQNSHSTKSIRKPPGLHSGSLVPSCWHRSLSLVHSPLWVSPPQASPPVCQFSS